MPTSKPKRAKTTLAVDGKSNLAQAAYESIKRDIFAFRLLPGQRFSETTLAAELGMSRTPLREALHKLEREGYLGVASHSGWYVQPFDFEMFDHLYDVRMVLEQAALARLCSLEDLSALDDLKAIWLAPKEKRLTDAAEVAQLDEAFHARLVWAAGNPELMKLYEGVIQRIRIIRRLDFTQGERVETTYEEHARILRAILRRRGEQAALLLNAHIQASKTEVRKITLHKLFMARQAP